MSLPLKVLLVDDHQMFREGVKVRLEQEPDVEIIGEASSAEEALDLVQRLEPTIAVVDIRLQGTSGIELARRLREQKPDLKIMVLTGYDFDQYVRALARIGIDGYLLKDSPPEDVLKAIHTVHEGESLIQPRVASRLLDRFSQLSQAGLGIRPLGQNGIT